MLLTHMKQKMPLNNSMCLHFTNPVLLCLFCHTLSWGEKKSLTIKILEEKPLLQGVPYFLPYSRESADRGKYYGPPCTILYNAVRPVEVCHNDGDGQGDAEDAADGAKRGHQLPGRRGRRNVAVAGAGHRDDGPVEGLRQRVEHRVGLVLLERVAKPGKDEHSHADRHAQ